MHPAGVPAAPAERVLTLPLCAFLVLVAGALVAGWLTRPAAADLPGAVRLLADGDLDGAERRAVLRQVRQLAAPAATPAAAWAHWLAGIALAEPGLGDAPPAGLPAADELRWLHLGDALLGSVVAAACAERGGDRGAAAAQWRRVAAQARLSRQSVAGELAAAALRRLGD